MQMTMTSFRQSSSRVAAQSVARLALNDMKKNLGVAKYVNMSQDAPITLPATGFIYFDTINSQFVVQSSNGSPKHYAVDPGIASEIELYFDITGLVDANGEHNTIDITILVDKFTLRTEVFVQNLSEFGGKIIPDYDPMVALHPAQYVQFE